MHTCMPHTYTVHMQYVHKEGEAVLAQAVYIRHTHTVPPSSCIPLLSDTLPVKPTSTSKTAHHYQPSRRQGLQKKTRKHPTFLNEKQATGVATSGAGKKKEKLLIWNVKLLSVSKNKIKGWILVVANLNTVFEKMSAVSNITAWLLSSQEGRSVL